MWGLVCNYWVFNRRWLLHCVLGHLPSNSPDILHACDTMECLYTLHTNLASFNAWYINSEQAPCFIPDKWLENEKFNLNFVRCKGLFLVRFWISRRNFAGTVTWSANMLHRYKPQRNCSPWDLRCDYTVWAMIGCERQQKDQKTLATMRTIVFRARPAGREFNNAARRCSSYNLDSLATDKCYHYRCRVWAYQSEQLI